MAGQGLSFADLREQNVPRCLEAFGHRLDDWSLQDWACAMGGECGEALNLVKKTRRDGDLATRRKALADELADLIIYADLLAARADIDLGQAVRDKFNRVSKLRGNRRRV